MTDAPPWHAVADRLIGLIAHTGTNASLNMLWKTAAFRADYDSLPKIGKADVDRAGKAHRATFLTRAG